METVGKALGKETDTVDLKIRLMKSILICLPGAKEFP